MKNTKTTCTRCRTPIINRAANGRPDVWGHTTVTNPFCPTPSPPYLVEQNLPRETRTIRIRVEEVVTYDWEMKFEVHLGVTPDALSPYLSDHEERWIDSMEDNYHSARIGEIVSSRTYFADDAGYLACLDQVLAEHPEKITKWLTLTCPVCGVQPGAEDTEHQNVGYFVAIACEGLYVVNPGWVGMDGSRWEDWTKDVTVNASRKAGN